MFNLKFFTKEIPLSLVEKGEILKSEFQNHISIFNDEAENALSIFRSTIERLDNVDIEIQEKRDVLNKFILEFSNLDLALSNRQKSNANIKNKFQNFLD